MPISRHQLAASVLAAAHIAERAVIAAFVADPATQPAPNPFPQTSAGAVRQVWRQRAAEFRAFDVEAIGLASLLTTVASLRVDEALVQEIVRAGPHTANVFHHGDGCGIIGAVLYGKPGVALPASQPVELGRPASSRRSRAYALTGQLDLFARNGS